ncbi:MAG: hypothetical protein KC517_02415 [Bacteroidetes bacterium]|jgi:hypothetical protein|nr:hypothetical protein [Bacteroidota bacterium]
MSNIDTYAQLELHNDLLQAVIDQVNKDFGSSEIELKWDADSSNPFNEFVSQAESIVEHLLLTNTTFLKSALYRMDVFESKLRMAWTLDHKDQVKRVTELILNRALQKVLTRRMYKQK